MYVPRQMCEIETCMHHTNGTQITMETSEQKRLLHEFESDVRRVWEQIPSLGPNRPIPRLIVKIVPGEQFTAEVDPISDELVIIRFYEACVMRSFDVIGEHQEDLLACIDPDEHWREMHKIGKQDILTVLYTLITFFVISHELSHVICGHVTHGFERFSESTDIAGEVVYHITEMEADNTGIELLTGHIALGDVHRICDPEGLQKHTSAPTIVDYRGAQRLLSFRCLLVAIWLSTAFFEMEYAKSESLTRYPLPSARLHASVNTLMAEYAGLTPQEADDGSLHGTLGEGQQDQIMEFLQNVLRPVVFPMQSVLDDDVYSLLLASQESEDQNAAVVQFFQDVAGLMLDRELMSLGAQQLRDLQPYRLDIEEALSPFRYFDQMTK